MADQTPSGAVLDVPSIAKELGLRFAEAGHELYLVGGSVRDLMLGRARRDLDFATSAHPEQTTRVLRGWAERRYLVGVTFGTVGALEGRAAARDHDVPPGGLRRGTPQAGRHVRRRHRDRPVPPRLHDQRDGGAASRRRARRPVRRRPPPRREGARHPARTRGLVHRRSAAHAAGRALRLAARRRPRRSAWWPPSRDARAPRDRLGRADRRRARRSCWSVSPSRRVSRCWSSTGLADTFLPELAALELEQDPVHQHKDVLRHTYAVVESCEPDRRAAARRAAARHRQAVHPPDHARGRAVPPPRGRRRAHGRQAPARAALPQPGDRRRAQARRDAPALPRLRRRLERRGRAPIRARRRPAARQAQPAHARRRDHAQRAPRREVPGAAGRPRGAHRAPRRAGEPRGAASAARREAGDGPPRPRARPGGGRGARVPHGAPHGTRSHPRGRGLRPARRVGAERARAD